jgi:peptide/nickel transport system ATP-binding protein/oligopeptide transport system ATP-binding protein
MGTSLLEVNDLKTYFFTRRGVVRAVDGVSFSVKAGETLGIVGESGCGKTITSLSILRLVPQPAGKIVEGEIIFKGENLLAKSEKEMRKLRGRRISMILQDPMTSMDPLYTVGEQVAEPIRTHQNLEKKGVLEQVIKMLKLVRIPAPSVRMREYPHQMSGGMKQRIVGAMALSCQPGLLIADEPTTALDVTIQAQFLRLLKEIQEEVKAAMIMITHDFGIVAKICDRVAVMYAGRIVESAATRDLFNRPSHPYTKALIGALPKMGEKLKKLVTIDGQPPDLRIPIKGCSFGDRCPNVMEICRRESPSLNNIKYNHSASCWLLT